MPDGFKTALSKSRIYVERYKDDVLKVLHGSDILPCEGEDNDTLRFLDGSCGIDYFVVHNRNGITHTVASRFQTDTPQRYKTFTIRKSRDSGTDTEFKKRKLAIENGGIYPYYTLQAYVDEEHNRINRIAVALTEEIIRYCETELTDADIRHTGYNQIGQASFYVVDWVRYANAGNRIAIYDSEEDVNIVV